MHCHECLDVLKVRRRHPFLASGTVSPAFEVEEKHHILRHKCLDVAVVRRRHLFLASSTFSPAFEVEEKHRMHWHKYLAI